MSSQDRLLIHERRRADRKREIEVLHQRELQALKNGERKQHRKFEIWNGKPGLC